MAFAAVLIATEASEEALTDFSAASAALSALATALSAAAEAFSAACDAFSAAVTALSEFVDALVAVFSNWLICPEICKMYNVKGGYIYKFCNLAIMLKVIFK